jgi:hypothetical protein
VVGKVHRGEALSQEEREYVNRAINMLSQRALANDKWTYRMVVAFLGVVAVLTVIGGFVLVGVNGFELHPNKSPIPSGLVALGSAAIGALAGLLAPNPRRNREP